MFELIEPENYQEIGAEFVVSGWMPAAWALTDYGIEDRRLFTEFIDSYGKTFMGGGIEVNDQLIKNRYFFSQVVRLNWMNVEWVKKSEGRIVLKLYGHDEKSQYIFIPLIVKEFVPKKNANIGIIAQHGKVSEIIDQHKASLMEYYKELSAINDSREEKSKVYDKDKINSYNHATNLMLTVDILRILNESEDEHSEYIYSDEDEREQNLNKKYKLALDWRGLLAKGLVGNMNGFQFRVYSNDHDKHFHVIHSGKKINARFSFPDLELINYKQSGNTISSNEESRIRNYFKNPENFKKLESEFKKRDE